MKTLTIGGTTYTIAGGVESVQGKTGNVVLTASDLKFLLPVDSVSGAVASFPDGADNVPVEALSVTITPAQSGSGTPAPDNVRPISGWSEARIWCEATHDTSADPKITIDLSGTRYGGTLDIKTGVLTVTHLSQNMGDLTWNRSGSWLGAPALYSNGLVSVIVKPSPSVAANGWCACYPVVARAAVDSNPDIKALVINNDGLVVVRDSSYSDGATFKTAMSGMTLVYELATKPTVQLDPATLSSLYGTNNIWANCGDVSVSYRADIQKYIDKKTS